jgi:DHA1 family bicyclomycin/chloramphenicol resistance-like MFS transporter
VARFILGFSAAAGFVINNAFIRDVSAGQNASRLYSTQAAISSLAPVIAPLVGGQLLLLGDWHVVFIFLVFLGAAVLGMAAWLMPESLDPANRSQLSFKATFASWSSVIRDRRFVALGLTSGILFGMVCVFIAGAPFALEGEYRLTPTQYTLAFASVTIIMFSANSVNRWFLKRVASIKMLRYGLSQSLLSAAVMTGTSLLGIHSLVLTLIGFALAISANGFIMANIMGLAMRDHGERAGTAAGLIGFSNSIFGAVAAPLTSVFFGLDVTGVTTFMSILIVIAVTIGLVSLRHEKGSAD